MTTQPSSLRHSRAHRAKVASQLADRVAYFDVRWPCKQPGPTFSTRAELVTRDFSDFGDKVIAILAVRGMRTPLAPIEFRDDIEVRPIPPEYIPPGVRARHERMHSPQWKVQDLNAMAARRPDPLRLSRVDWRR